MPLATTFDQILDDLPPDWSDLYFDLILPDEVTLDEARLTMAPTQLERVPGERELFRFHVSRAEGYGCFADLARSRLALLDAAHIRGELRLARTMYGVRRNYTQGPAIL